jgi:hypothetical protein
VSDYLKDSTYEALEKLNDHHQIIKPPPLHKMSHSFPKFIMSGFLKCNLHVWIGSYLNSGNNCNIQLVKRELRHCTSRIEET